MRANIAQPSPITSTAVAKLKQLNAERQERFLAAYSAEGTVLAGCEAAGITRAAVYHWTRVDAVFAERCAQAHETFTDKLEREMFRRAVEGEPEPVLDRKTGAVVGTIHRKSDRLLEFALKGMRPGKYREIPGPQDMNERRRVLEEELARLGLAALAAAQAQASSPQPAQLPPGSVTEPEPAPEPAPSKEEPPPVFHVQHDGETPAEPTIPSTIPSSDGAEGSAGAIEEPPSPAPPAPSTSKKQPAPPAPRTPRAPAARRTRPRPGGDGGGGG